MKIVTRKRNKGKTTFAVKQAIKSGAYLVVRSHAVAVALARKYPTLRFPITYNELLRDHLVGSYVRNIIIDDADDFLRHVCPGLVIDLVTLTKEVKEPKNDIGELNADKIIFR